MPISEFNSELANRKPCSTIRLLLADDHPLIRKALEDVFDRHDDFGVVAEASDGKETRK